MKVLIVGAHGQIGQSIGATLAVEGNEVVGLIRKEEQKAALEVAGVHPAMLDITKASPEELAVLLHDVDATVFAAGAGPGSTAQAKIDVDQNGAVLLANAMELAHIRRTVQISSMGVEVVSESNKPAGMDEVFYRYLLAKANAEEDLRRRDLDWTIVRPGALTNQPAADRVSLQPHTERGSIPRTDVAAVVVELLKTGAAVQQTLELVQGTESIAEAVSVFADPSENPHN